MIGSLLSASEVVAQRVFNHAYIYLDTAFLVLLMALLIFRKKYLTALFGLFGGVLYMIVDYGIFHLALHTRSIEGGNMFGVLLWMSMSYGITNFVWIWLWMSKDKHAFEWTALIVIWWIAAPMIAGLCGGTTVKIQRTTGAYHGAMAIILFVGYAAAIVYNLVTRDRSKRFPVFWLLAIGISVQLGWEFSLLLGGIRSAEFGFEQKLTTLVVNSLLETNLGAVPIYCIYVWVTSRLKEDLKRREKVSFTSRLAELNAARIMDRSPKREAMLAAKTDGIAVNADNGNGESAGERLHEVVGERSGQNDGIDPPQN